MLFVVFSALSQAASPDVDTGLPAGRIALTPTLGVHPDRQNLLTRTGAVVGLGGTWYLSDIFGLDVAVDWFPDGGRADWKPITKQIISQAAQSERLWDPNRSVSGGFAFFPLGGALFYRERRIAAIEPYGVLGTGAVWTVDNLQLLQKEGEPVAENTARQVHPALVWAAGAQVGVPGVRFKAEVRSRHFIEVLESSILERARVLTISGGVSLVLPARSRP